MNKRLRVKKGFKFKSFQRFTICGQVVKQPWALFDHGADFKQIVLKISA